MIPDFEVRTVHHDGQATLFVRGEIDIAVHKRFVDALQAAQDESTDVVVDLTEVTFIDSAGISALMRGYKDATDPSRLRLVGVRPSIRRVLEITGVAHLLLEVPTPNRTDP